jgi:protein-S-isoprenylcysteine O-methyltransferase Ste14
VVTSESDLDPESVRLIGITRRIGGEERALTALLPGYADYIKGRQRLIPFLW